MLTLQVGVGMMCSRGGPWACVVVLQACWAAARTWTVDDHSGDIVIRDSVIRDNRVGSWYPTYPQISNHDDTPIAVTASTIE